jgi:hypothetical protein
MYTYSMVKRHDIKFLVILLTFVLIPLSKAHSAPVNVPPDAESQSPNEGRASAEGSSEKLDTMNVAEPRKEKQEQLPQYHTVFFYPYQCSMSPRLGALYDLKNSSDGQQIDYIVGFNYMFHSVTSRHIEIGADLFSIGLGRLHGGWRWIYQEHSRFRPFSKLALGLEYDGAEGLGSFLDFGNYQVIATGGLEYMIIDPASLRLDLDVTFSRDRLFTSLTIGYSWAW